MHPSDLSVLRGQIVQFNLSPKGVPEGIVLRPDGGEGGRFVQINFNPELAGQVTALTRPGETVTAEAFPFRDAESDAHPVFELIRLTAADGRVLTADGPPEVGVRVRGSVVAINYARRGEPNGGLLDTGDFVHLRPHGAKAIGLAIGQVLDAEGDVRAGWSGHRVVEARVANGVALELPGYGHKSGPHHGRGHGHRHRPGHRQDAKPTTA